MRCLAIAAAVLILAGCQSADLGALRDTVGTTNDSVRLLNESARDTVAAFERAADEARDRMADAVARNDQAAAEFERRVAEMNAKIAREFDEEVASRIADAAEKTDSLTAAFSAILEGAEDDPVAVVEKAAGAAAPYIPSPAGEIIAILSSTGLIGAVGGLFVQGKRKKAAESKAGELSDVTLNLIRSVEKAMAGLAPEAAEAFKDTLARKQRDRTKDLVDLIKNGGP